MLENSKERPRTARKKQSLQEQIAAYVQTHLAEKITLKIIAAHCGISVSTVTQLFQKKMNMTFHEYVTHQRMQTAEELIHRGIPLEQVGKQVGYQDHSTFYRAFHRYFGMSPREYRLRMNPESMIETAVF